MYTIQPGDHLWSIAQAELARRHPDRLVTDREITTYWKRLCNANVANLRDPNNLDLIFPGDTLVIPE
jgi:nucleoid-associated protein YgaU